MNEDIKISSYSTDNCFIVTAVYGSQLSNRIKPFRNYRDITLNKNAFGRMFIKIYYKISPYMANYIRKREVVRKLVRKIILEPMLNILIDKGY